MKSKAAVAWEPKKPLEIEEVEVEGPREGEVLLKVHASGVCHTDAFSLSGEDPEASFPAILGHEGGCEVVECGPGVKTLKQGDHAIVVDHSYARNFMLNFFHEYGVETTIVQGTTVQEFEDAIRPNTRLIYLESPSSMIFNIQDLSAVSALARSKNIITAIDNTWATPINQKPHTFGIDIVIHSLSKYVGGHSDIIGGAATGSWATAATTPTTGSGPATRTRT